MLHTKCGSRLKQQYICPKEGTSVEKDEIAKGYEFSKGQYVVFSAEELKALDEKATNTIDIAEFVPLARWTGSTSRRSTTSAPTRAASGRTRCSPRRWPDTGRAALGQYSARGKQYLVLVRPMGDVLVMEQLHYADELRSADDVPRPEARVKDARARARAAAHRADPRWTSSSPRSITTRCASACSRRSSAKVDGQDITAEPTEAPQTKIIDLMEALKASLAKRGTTTEEKKPALQRGAQGREGVRGPAEEEGRGAR